MGTIRLSINDISEFAAVIRGLRDEGVEFEAEASGGCWEIEVKPVHVQPQLRLSSSIALLAG